jgi:integrase
VSSLIPPRRHDLTDPQALTFNFAGVLPGRAGSPHTARAYYRWVDTFLVDMADMKPTRGDARTLRMQALPVDTLRTLLSPAMLRAWLGKLSGRNHGKQGIEQARAAIVTLADLFAEAEWMPETISAAIARVRSPRAEDGQRQGRWLALREIRQLMASAGEIATSDAQEARNRLAVTMLCTMALRREELCAARWGDLTKQDDRVVLRVHGKGRKVASVDVPPNVLRLLETWRKLCLPNTSGAFPASPLIRRIWRGGRVSKGGMTPEGILLLVDAASRHAGIGHVAPHDLRRSVAGALHESGVPVEKISRLLRHSNINVTERYLNRLPMKNEGALLMDDLLGRDDEGGLWD